MAYMNPRWDQGNQRWECSLGSGKNRVWFRCKIAGEAGRETCAEKKRLHLEGPKPLMPGSLAEFIECVWWPRVKAGTTQATRDGYLSTLKLEISKFYSWQITDLRLEVLQPWVSQMRLGPKTVHNRYRVMSSILDLAHKTGRYPMLDHKLVVLPEIPESWAVEGLEIENIAKLLAAANGTIWEGPIWSAVFLGLRRNEVCGLKKGHVVLEGEEATITLQDNRQPKGETKKLKNRATGEVRALRVPRAFADKLLSFGSHDGLYVFHGKTGKPICPSSLTVNTPKLCAQGGAVRLAFKDLRAACRSNLEAAGVSAVVIMQILGHRDYKTSLRYQDKRMSKQIEAFLGVTDDWGRAVTPKEFSG